MRKVVWDSGFKKSYAKKIKNDPFLKQKFWAALELFATNPFHQRLKTHKLSGILAGLWAFSVAYDCRVIFRFIETDDVLLIDIGSHDEVY